VKVTTGLGVRVAAAAVAAAAILTLPGPAEAKWRKVTSQGQTGSTSEVGIERSANGVLHVLWPSDSGATEQLMHSAISENGRSIAGPHQVASTTNFINNSVDLVAGPSGGLRAFFAGVFPGVSNDAIRTSTASASGTTWSGHAAASQTSAGPTNAAAGSGIGATVTPAGTPWSSWGDSSPGGGGFHAGINPAANDLAFSSGCCERDPNLAFDSQTGVVAVGWNYLPTGPAARRLQVVVPFVTGVQDAPMSAATWTGQRVGLTGRIGAGGIYAAYGAGTNQFNARPALWRLGAAGAKVLKSPRDAEHTTVAPAPGGRLWLAWEGKDRGFKIFATRTSPAAKPKGAIVATKPPKGTQQIYRVNVEGSRGYLDVLALVRRGSGEIAWWHARLRPGLSLRATPQRVRTGRKVTFKVTDAGQPVAGAKVALKLANKHTKKTNGAGKTTIKVPKSTKPRRYRARATKGGYAAAKRKVKVVR